MRGLNSNYLLLAAAAVVLYVYSKGRQVVEAGQNALKPITDPIGNVIGHIRYGSPGSGVQATESYIVLRRRDFPSGTMTESAYTAALTMHRQNASILQTVLTPSRQLKTMYAQALSVSDPIIVTDDGAIHRMEH